MIKDLKEQVVLYAKQANELQRQVYDLRDKLTSAFNTIKGLTDSPDVAITAHRLELTKQYLRDLAYTGSNGSPFPDEPRRELQSRYSNAAWQKFIEIFGETP